MKTEFSGCFGRTKNDFNVIKTREKQKADKQPVSLPFKTLLVFILFLFSLTMTACGSKDSNPTPPEIQPKSSVTMKVSQKGSTVECPNGGISIKTGIDDNGNGVLDPGEEDDTQVLCNGVDGGLTTLISITDEAPGDNCTYGGKKIETGADNNGDGELGSDEVDEINYVCNGEDGVDGQNGQDGQDGVDGQDGQDGQNGLTTLISITDEAPGENCPNGGVKIDAGLDDDGEIGLAPAEVDVTKYVCDGNDAPAHIISVTDAGESCPNGGKKIEVGIDDNDDGVLDPEEVDDTWYVCNGQDGQDGTDGQDGAGGANGQDGLTSIIFITDEGPGGNCTYGGKKIEVGLDDSDINGILDPDEIDATHYVCNGGGDGTSGLTSLVLITEEPAGLNCADGGIKVEVGLDNDRDGNLDIPDEVDDTAYVCNGKDGTGGGGPYSVGGTVSGLSGTFALQLNENEQLDVAANGEFRFSTLLNSGSNYGVTVATQPANQTCTVVNGKGSIPGANVTGILVFCSVDTYTVGGDVSGLDSGNTVTLQNNGGDDLDVTANEGFTFATELADGSPYTVTVLIHPVAQICIITNGIGTISSPDVTEVTDVAVVCEPDTEAPTVDSTFPINGATEISLDATLAAIFSESMDESTITTSTFTLYDVTISTSVNGTVAYDNNSKSATFDPDEDLTVGHEYTATITTDATDLAHNALVLNEEWSFTAIDVSCTTTVEPGLVAGQTWTIDGSPYCVTGDIQVSLLTVEPGVEVLVDGPYEIEILSTIKAIGTEGNPILFSSKKPTEPTNQRWKGFKLHNIPPGSEFTYTIIEYSDDSGVTFIDSYAPVFNNCTIRNNHKIGKGGGISIDNITTDGINGDLDLSYCIFSGNTATGHGGALHVIMSEGYTLNIDNSLFENNTSNPWVSKGNFVGGAIYLQEGDAIIKNSQFIGNLSNAQCSSYGCGVLARGGAIFIAGTGNITIENSEFRVNQANAIHKVCYGGSSYSRSYGGAVYVYSGTVMLTNNVLSGNMTTRSNCRASDEGGGLFVKGGAVTVINSTIARNPNSTGVYLAGGTLNIMNSIIYFNNADGTQVGGVPTITYSDVYGGYDGEGNIDFNPAFVGTEYEASDFELAVGSSAIDAGTPDIAYDDVCFPPSHDTVTNDIGAYGGPLACDW